MMNHGVLKLKNSLLDSLLDFLSTPVPAQTARPRNQFILLFKEQVHKKEDLRMKLIEEYGEHEADGTLKIGRDGHYVIKDQKTFDAKYQEIADTVFEMPCRGEELTMFNVAFSILATLNRELTVEQTRDYDLIMKAFEEWKGSLKKDA